MDESSLRSILGRLGITLGRRNRRGWIEFKCPLASWTHERGYDTRPSAAASVNEHGSSSYVCKACHSHGRIAKLVNELAGFRRDNSIRPLMMEADRADAQAQISAPFPDFDRVFEVDEIPPALVEEAYEGLYDPAWIVPEARAYLQSRNIGEATTRALRLHYDHTANRDGILEKRILFPVNTRTGFYGFTGRTIDDENVKPKVRDYFGLPKRHLILGEHRWRPDMPKIIIEGLFGLAHLMEIGAEEFADIGAILGSAMTSPKAARIIDADCPTYLLLDNDAGGDIGLFGTPLSGGGRENGAIDMLTDHVPLFVPEWPAGKSDPDQLTLDEVRDMVTKTPPYTSTGQNLFDQKYEIWQ
jgi:hypothetical protein